MYMDLKENVWCWPLLWMFDLGFETLIKFICNQVYYAVNITAEKDTYICILRTGLVVELVFSGSMDCYT